MSALEQLVANMTVAQLAEAAGLSVDEVVALVLRRGRARGETGEEGTKRTRAPEPLMPRAGEIVIDDGARRRGARGRGRRNAVKTKKRRS
jgi:hypothetical protein